jgi:hypothetical protein
MAFAGWGEPPSKTTEPEPVFRPPGLDMTKTGWSLNLPCQVAADDRPESCCRLPAGHGGCHEDLVGGQVVQWSWGPTVSGPWGHLRRTAALPPPD